MRTLRKKYPVWVSIVLVAGFLGASVLGSLPLLLWKGAFDQGEYLPQLIVELFCLAVLVLLTLLLRMGDTFRRGRLGLGQTLLPMLPILLLYTYSAAGQWIISCMGKTPLPGLRVLWYVLCMLAVGITEELLFRGLITRMIFEKYGKSSVGVWLTVLVSSLLFGTVHLINAVGGMADLGGVLVQMVGAAALGMCICAIYLRTGSLWAVALLHAFMDLVALLPSGVYGVADLGDMVSGYSWESLVASLVYVALALFLLRPSKLKTIIGPPKEPAQGLVIKLMLAVMLLSGLWTAVLVMLV